MPASLWNPANTIFVEEGIYTVPTGLVSDGVTDNYTALQAAIDEVYAAGGGTVFIPAASGMYGLAQTVLLKSKVRLLGAGRGASVIYALPSLARTSPMIKNASGDTGFDVFADYDITLEHITFDGGGRTFPAYDQNTNPPTYGGISQASSRGHLIRMYSVERFASLNCEYRNHKSNAPLVCAGGRDQLIKGNWFHHNGKIDDISPCLFVSPSFPNSTPNYNCTATNNHFWDCDRMAARFEVDGGVFTNNIMDGMGEGGIHVKKTRFLTISNNTFRNFRITDIVANGIEMEFEDDLEDGLVTICNNVFEEIGGTAIALNGAQSVVVSGNIIRNCGFDTVYPAPNGPLNYAAGRSAGDPVNVTKRCGISVFTADTYQVRHAIIKDNVIVDTAGFMMYGIVFASTGTPLEQFDNVVIRDNVIVGAVTAKYYLPTSAAVGANVIVGELVDASNKQILTELSISEGYAVVGSPVIAYSGTNSGRVIAFDGTSTESWQWTLTPPATRPIGAVLAGFRIYGQKAVSAGTGTVIFEVATEPRIAGASNIGGGTFETQQFAINVGADGVSTIELNDLTLTTPVEWATTYFILFRLSRIGGTDTWNNDYYVIAVQPIFK